MAATAIPTFHQSCSDTDPDQRLSFHLDWQTYPRNAFRLVLSSNTPDEWFMHDIDDRTTLIAIVCTQKQFSYDDMTQRRHHHSTPAFPPPPSLTSQAVQTSHFLQATLTRQILTVMIA
jgi:hypothetical protein